MTMPPNHIMVLLDSKLRHKSCYFSYTFQKFLELNLLNSKEGFINNNEKMEKLKMTYEITLGNNTLISKDMLLFLAKLSFTSPIFDS